MSGVTPAPKSPAIARLMQHREIRKRSFTGSTDVGRVRLQLAAESIISARMELAGYAGPTVLAGAELVVAIKGSVLAKQQNGVYAFTATIRLDLHSSLRDEFVIEATAGRQSVRTGAALDRHHTLGVLVLLKERDKADNLIRTAATDGGTLVLGGHPIDGGALLEPTLLTAVEHASTINQAEMFGPPSAIVRFGSVNEARYMVTDMLYGLIPCLFGEEGEAIVSPTDSGRAWSQSTEAASAIPQRPGAG